MLLNLFLTCVFCSKVNKSIISRSTKLFDGDGARKVFNTKVGYAIPIINRTMYKIYHWHWSRASQGLECQYPFYLPVLFQPQRSFVLAICDNTTPQTEIGKCQYSSWILRSRFMAVNTRKAISTCSLGILDMASTHNSREHPCHQVMGIDR